MNNNRLLLSLPFLALPLYSLAEPVETEDWGAKFQTTYVWQGKKPFVAAYSGTNSLSTAKESSYSFTATAALGVRPWSGGELYLDPECAQGTPLSNLTGFGGFTNGEIARTAGPVLKCYRARMFLRQTFGLGGSQEAIESDLNQLAGMQDKNRIVVTIGNLAVPDLFDDNTYNHDPRTQFLNWSLMSAGAYDFPADARGYTWGFAAEYLAADWAIRAGRFIQPKEPNQLPLDRRIFVHYGDQIEVERTYALGDQPGKIRLLLFSNRARMARFQDAIDLATTAGEMPDLNRVRFGEQFKRGYSVNVEQAAGAALGLFARFSQSDGRTEVYAFTEIDRSLSAGLLAKGSAWGRADDTVGLALAQNGLSSAHRRYLEAGGLGFFVGDGRLNYRDERIVEGFYSLALEKHARLSIDWQQVRNPAYNADRGPVKMLAMRLHIEF